MWVTGASGGIGRVTAAAFARAGASVALTARSTEKLEAIARQLHPCEGKVVVFHHDVTDRDESFSVAKKIVAELGRIDILVNNAGIGHCRALDELSRAEIDRIAETNFLGAIHCIHAALPAMRAQHDGQIVNIASTAAYKGIPLLGVYCATKFALRALSDAIRLELRQDGIGVICLSPGTTDTEFFDHALTGPQGWVLKGVGAMRPDKVADAIVRTCHRHRREVVLTAEGKAMVVINKLLPSLVDALTMKVALR